MFRILFLLLLLFITAISCGGYWIYKYQLIAPLPLYDDLHYTVPPNATLRQVAIDLMDQGLMNYSTALAWFSLARWQKRAHLIKVGEYIIPKDTTPQQLLDILIAGKNIQYSLTIPEGWNFRQLIAAIHKHPNIVETLDNIKYQAIMAKLGWADQHPEGRFYPDTYFFPTGTTDVEFLQRAYKMMQKELKAVWEKRRDDLPLKTPYEALILASIVEKETAVVEERPLIAGVFVRRLEKKMRLQTDPTVIYGLGDAYNGNIRKSDLKRNNPYNTYLNKGLPPTPIAMPGRAALYAAVNPAEGDALFFVAKGNQGHHYFSATYKEHACAVIEYQLKGKSSRYQSQCKKYPSCAACRG
ncbi:MAG: endolytic transglycosylase MltG [Gammaproteobacteria bacterium]|nr:MAG: endolytic transglycosylase MltG [Gammaproteobacteria bacterium]RKZ42624.1 MAG: endolytic transglycosylase MltG [Gammaproteobacteria bacterium]RKZ76682.1 MAG: endolytic transglycosylase MltG [Gammaproteobacteria bacterium]